MSNHRIGLEQPSSPAASPAARARRAASLCTAVSIAALLIAGCRKSPEQKHTAESVQPVNVIVQPPKEFVFEDRYTCKGTVLAVRTANVAARIPGVIDDLFVDRADRVKTGQSLFQTDRVNLENNVAIREHELEVAKAGVKEAESGVTKAQALLEKARVDRERFQNLYTQHRAVTKDQFEKADTAWKQARAGVDYAQATLLLARARVRQAENALKIAQKQLDDSLVKAPFDGVVTRKFLEQGEFAGAGTPVVRIESAQNLEVSAFVAGQYYHRIRVGETPVRVSADGVPPLSLTITFKAPVVNPVSRTFEIKVNLPPATALAPGMMCDMAVILESRSGLGVPERAVLPLAGAHCVFVVEKGRARRINVRPGLHTDGFVEIRNADAVRNRRVVVDGQTFLRDGAPVQVLSGSGAQRPPADGPAPSTPPSPVPAH